MNFVRFATIAFAIVATTMSGYATFLNDDHKMVAFSSSPENATVKVDGVSMEKTPCVVPVPRKGGDKLITFSLEGYKTLIVTLNNKIDAAGFGNIILGGIIGVGIDAMTGRAGNYQDSLHVELERGNGTLRLQPNEPKTTTNRSESDARDRSQSNTSEYSEETQNWILNKDD